MLTITRKLEFDAGHRVLGHEGKCRHLHGHRYALELSVTGPKLDKVGRVLDYSVLKSVVGGWIDDNLDHNFIAHPDDPLLEVWKHPQVCLSHSRQVYANDVFAGKDPFVMPAGQNPTAENLAYLLFYKAAELLAPHGITVTFVRLYETPNCWADFFR